VARPVHERLRLEYDKPLTFDIKLRNLALKTTTKPDRTVPLNQSFNGTKSDIVSSFLIARTRIAQTDD
jgi:hypothetical protein